MADLPAPISPVTEVQEAETATPLIACIDDSPLICETMNIILKKLDTDF